MAKFGMFNGAGQLPIQEFEGDYMMQNGEYVTIFKEKQGGAGQTGWGDPPRQESNNSGNVSGQAA